ncbi:MAG: class II aldolase/adducin family protein [Thermoanaerobaculia bacterium]|nr:class II aldolase/adducin family protein [Thermoanaerobaculia bacterium]
MEHLHEREAVLAAARRAVAVGLTHGTSGNVSVRIPGGMVITPTGLEYDLLTPEEVVATDLEGRPLPGERRAPSSEWPMHAAVYRARPEIGAVVHGHSPAAAAFSCLGRDLPPFHYMIAAAGGDSIRCAEYALFGTPELAAHALAALSGRRACFLARHGFLSLGATAEEALALAVEVEFLADAFLRLLPLREPPRLSGPEMKKVLARFATYGQQPRG